MSKEIGFFKFIHLAFVDKAFYIIVMGFSKNFMQRPPLFVFHWLFVLSSGRYQNYTNKKFCLAGKTWK